MKRYVVDILEASYVNKIGVSLLLAVIADVFYEMEIIAEALVQFTQYVDSAMIYNHRG